MLQQESLRYLDIIWFLHLNILLLLIQNVRIQMIPSDLARTPAAAIASDEASSREVPRLSESEITRIANRTINQLKEIFETHNKKEFTDSGQDEPCNPKKVYAIVKKLVNDEHGADKMSVLTKKVPLEKQEELCAAIFDCLTFQLDAANTVSDERDDPAAALFTPLGKYAEPSLKLLNVSELLTSVFNMYICDLAQTPTGVRVLEEESPREVPRLSEPEIIRVAHRCINMLNVIVKIDTKAEYTDSGEDKPCDPKMVYAVVKEFANHTHGADKMSELTKKVPPEKQEELCAAIYDCLTFLLTASKTKLDGIENEGYRLLTQMGDYAEASLKILIVTELLNIE